MQFPKAHLGDDVKEKLKTGIRNSLLDPEEGYLEVLSIDPGDEEALRGLIGLYKPYESCESELIGSLYKQLMDFHPHNWRYFHEEATRQKGKGNYSEAIGYFELAFKKLVLYWHDLKTGAPLKRGLLHKTEAYRIIDTAITNIRQDIEEITRDILPVMEKPSEHLKEHTFVQQLIEAKDAIATTLLEKLLVSGKHVTRALTGIIRGYSDPFFMPGRQHVVLNAMRLVGEKRDKVAISYLVNILKTSDSHMRKESMIALRKLYQRHPQKVLSCLKTAVYEDSPLVTLLSIIEIIGWIGKHSDTLGFLQDIVQHITLIPRKYRGDVLEFVCGALSSILGKDAIPMVKRICIDYAQWIVHKDVEYLPKFEFITRGKEGIFKESIYDKCCRRPTKMDALKSMTATYVWEIYKSLGKKSFHSHYMLASLFANAL